MQQQVWDEQLKVSMYAVVILRCERRRKRRRRTGIDNARGKRREGIRECNPFEIATSISLLHGSNMIRRILAHLGIVASEDKRGSAPLPAQPGISSSQARDKLLNRIGDINDFSRPRPLVTLAEFFEGNKDFGSIGYNLPDSPSPQEWFQILQAVAYRSEVNDIRIEIKDLEDPNGWPSTDTIWIITKVSVEQVRAWLPARIEPDDIIDGFDNSNTLVEQFEVPACYRAIGLWYG